MDLMRHGCRCLPFFLACEMRSAALLLITLVTYKGQFVWLAIVIARNTASASSWNIRISVSSQKSFQRGSITTHAIINRHHCVNFPEISLKIHEKEKRSVPLAKTLNQKILVWSNSNQWCQFSTSFAISGSWIFPYILVILMFTYTVNRNYPANNAQQYVFGFKTESKHSLLCEAELMN